AAVVDLEDVIRGQAGFVRSGGSYRETEGTPIHHGAEVATRCQGPAASAALTGNLGELGSHFSEDHDQEYRERRSFVARPSTLEGPYHPPGAPLLWRFHPPRSAALPCLVRRRH